MEGFNATILLYGQTTSGKTYTMLGDLESPGILPYSIHEIFQRLQVQDNIYKIYISYLEIYNE